MELAKAEEWGDFPARDMINRLESARSQIEERFLEGGSVLETVINVLDNLLNLLDRIGNSLKEDEAAEATSRLQQTAGLLGELPAAQTHRKERLHAIGQLAQMLSDHVSSMEETLRYLRTFAMTAKITGANIPDFSSFAAELVERIQFATSEVQSLSAQIKALETRARTAIDADESSLETHFDNIPSIVTSLLANAGDIRKQRETLSSMMARVSEFARTIQGKIAQTLSAMQIGDITRQRIEHCQSAYTITEDYFSSDDGGPISYDERQAAFALITSLVHNQLVQITEDFNRETSKVVQNINSFCVDVTALLDIYRAMISENGNDTSNPMSLLQKDLSIARSVVDDIGIAVADVNQLGDGALETVETLTTSVETIQLVRRDIQYMALNTNLRCSKLGEEARAINVVTVELRTYSSYLNDDAEKILSDLHDLQTNASTLGEGKNNREDASTSGLGASIDSALSHLTKAGETMEANIEELRQSGEDVTSKVMKAISRLDFKAGIGETLTACTQEASLVYSTDDTMLPPEQALATISERIFKTYTMATERNIHTQALGSLIPVAPTIEQPEEEDLFADALF